MSDELCSVKRCFLTDSTYRASWVAVDVVALDLGRSIRVSNWECRTRHEDELQSCSSMYANVRKAGRKLRDKSASGLVNSEIRA